MSQRRVDGHRLVRDRRKRRSISVRSHELQRYWIRSLPSPSGSTFSSFIVLLQTIQVIRSKSGLRSSFIRPVAATTYSRHLPCIVACEHICRHYVSPNSHSMRFGPRHFSRLNLASSCRCSFSGLPFHGLSVCR